MTFSCGMDLSARDCHVCVIDEDLTLLVQQTEPMSFWCLSHTRGTVGCARPLGTHTESIERVGTDSPSVTALKMRARSTTGSTVLGKPTMAQTTPSRAEGEIFPIEKPPLLAG